MNTINHVEDSVIEQEVHVYVKIQLSIDTKLDKIQIGQHIIEHVSDGFSNHDDFVRIEILHVIEEAEVYDLE